jgi:hypothetical protein
LIEHEDDDLRDLPLIERKRWLARLIGRAKHAIQFVEHLTDDGPTVFDHVCRLGLDEPDDQDDHHRCTHAPRSDRRSAVAVAHVTTLCGKRIGSSNADTLTC